MTGKLSPRVGEARDTSSATTFEAGMPVALANGGLQYVGSNTDGIRLLAADRCPR